MSLGQKEFKGLELLVPLDDEEPVRIADGLLSFAALIAARAEQRAGHKRRLMQQLFPRPEAMGA